MKIDYKELLHGQYTNNSHNNQQNQKEVDQPRTEKLLKRGQRNRIQKKKMTPRRLLEEKMLGTGWKEKKIQVKPNSKSYESSGQTSG